MADLQILIKAVDSASAQINQVKQSLDTMGISGTKTAMATDTLTYAYTGLGRVMRQVIPTSGEIAMYMDASASATQKLTSAISGLNSGLTYAIISTNKMSVGMQALSITGANLGLGMVQWGIGQLQQYNALNELYGEINKDLTAGIWNLTEAERAKMEVQLKAAEATGKVSEANRKIFDDIERQIKEARLTDYIQALKEQYGLVTEEQQKQYEMQEQINILITKYGYSTEDAVNLVNALAAAEAKAAEATRAQAAAAEAAARALAERQAQMPYLGALAQAMGGGGGKPAGWSDEAWNNYLASMGMSPGGTFQTRLPGASGGRSGTYEYDPGSHRYWFNPSGPSAPSPTYRVNVNVNLDGKQVGSSQGNALNSVRETGG